jgi:hypothetical protein
MNASDIIKQKQNQVLYSSYYNPITISTLNVASPGFVSTITYSTLTVISTTSTFNGRFSTITSSVVSTVNNRYVYRCDPMFLTYEMDNQISDAVAWNTNGCINSNYVCAGSIPSKLQWVNNTSSTQSIYGATYSTFSTILYNSLGASTVISTLQPSTFTSTMTPVMIGPGPKICSGITFVQATTNNCNCSCVSLV